jgi:hypothetical protein
MDEAKQLLEHLKPEDIELVAKSKTPNLLCQNIMFCCMVLIDRLPKWSCVVSEVQHPVAFISNLK